MVVQVFIWFHKHEGVFNWFHWQWCAYGAVPVNLFIVLTTLNFAPDDTYQHLGGVKFQQKASIGCHILSALSPAVYPLEVEIRD